MILNWVQNILLNTNPKLREMRVGCVLKGLNKNELQYSFSKSQIKPMYALQTRERREIQLHRQHKWEEILTMFFWLNHWGSLNCCTLDLLILTFLVHAECWPYYKKYKKKPSTKRIRMVIPSKISGRGLEFLWSSIISTFTFEGITCYV